MTNIKTKILMYISIALLLVSTLFPLTAFADTTTCSDVLDDLQRDSTFDASYYPDVVDNYALDIITLAESVDNELFVYVYQPSAKTKPLVASSINISTQQFNINIKPLPYSLTLLSSDGVFQKYVVENFVVNTDNDVRYYAITSLYRRFDETLGDEQASGDNIVTEVDFNISKQWTFGELNDMPFVDVREFETIEITDKFVGFVRYYSGIFSVDANCDSHFVAFSTDRPIDKLIEADVTYSAQTYRYEAWLLGAHKEEKYGEKQVNLVAELTDEQRMEYNPDGLWQPTYVRDRIQTVDDFIANENFENVYKAGVFNAVEKYELDETAMNELKNKQWVLLFTETKFGITSTTSQQSHYSTIVGDVSILRLMFEYEGKVYNLGVIDNKQSGSTDPSNNRELLVELTEIGKFIIMILAILILLVLLMFIPGVLNVVISVLKFVGWVLLLPFRLIRRLGKAIFKLDKK